MGEVRPLQKPPGGLIASVGRWSLSTVPPDSQCGVEAATLGLDPLGHLRGGRQSAQPINGGLYFVIPPILAVASRDP
ncbi:hypothetical protein [Brevundimonas sp.]|uniref:hypothetical protein n=1 Tax=Brevundimonas sp. TaxID=1871086 RepID=UPI002D6C2EBC|nr:hypothetical protein [Brevundimonas sp.]HYC66588.1 hypothetical protein [Brevundimonas sp.]